MNKKTFSIRRFGTPDVNKVIRLLNLCFKRQFWPEWWNWKYKLNPAGFWGEKGDIWIAENMNEVVGHLAVIPLKIKLGTKTVTVAQPVDAATHPDYRGLGIFKTLLKKICSEAQNRYYFLFGFPNEFSYRPLPRLGWKTLGIVEFLKFLNYNRALRSFVNNSLVVWSGKTALRALRASRYVSSSLHLKKYSGEPVEIQKVKKFPDETDDFWEQVRSEYETIIERTATFLNWRFSKYFGNYQIYIARSIEERNIVGYLVLKKTETRNALNIIDLLALPGEDKCVLNLIDKAITIGKNEGLDLIHCRIPPWHKYARILYKLGFNCLGRTLRWLKMYQYRLVVYPLREKAKIPRMQEWFYTLTDTDDV